MIKSFNSTRDVDDLTPLHISINTDMNTSDVHTFYKNYAGDIFVLYHKNQLIGFIAISQPLWNRLSIVERCDKIGATCLSPLSPRPWGDEAVYFSDPDGNVLAVGRHLPTT
jgi:hypothetical protein